MVLRATILQRMAPKQSTNNVKVDRAFVLSTSRGRTEGRSPRYQRRRQSHIPKHARKTPQIPRPYHQQTYQKKHTPTNELLCVASLAQRCRRRRSSARPLGPDHSVATFHGKLVLAGPLGPRGALPLVVATRPQATRLRNSGTLLLAGPLCPGPLGPAAVTDDRHRQARTLVCWTKWWCSCCVARCPLVVFPTLPSEPCLLGRTLSVTPE